MDSEEIYKKQRELLHEQFELLAEKSSIDRTADELEKLTEQMVSIHRVLYSANF